MTERKRDHFATILVITIFLMLLAGRYFPDQTAVTVMIASAVSLPISIWIAVRSLL